MGLLAVLKIDITSFKIEQSRFLQSSVLSVRVHFATENGRVFVMAGFCNKLDSCRICKWKWRFLSRKRSKRLFKVSKVSLIQFYFRCVLFHCSQHCVVCAKPAFLAKQTQKCQVDQPCYCNDLRWCKQQWLNLRCSRAHSVLYVLISYT